MTSATAYVIVAFLLRALNRG